MRPRPGTTCVHGGSGTWLTAPTWRPAPAGRGGSSAAAHMDWGETAGRRRASAEGKEGGEGVAQSKIEAFLTPTKENLHKYSSNVNLELKMVSIKMK